MKRKHLVVDISNLFWRSISAQKRYGPTDAKDSAGLGLHMCLTALRKHWMASQPDKLAIAFEGKDNWRKAYTKSEECYSKRLYKGNRVKDPNMASLFEVMQAFEDLAREHTSIVTLKHPKLEGDDLISGYSRYYAQLGDEVEILSGDKDFVQEQDDPNITLLNPDKAGSGRTLLEVCEVDDAGYFMFEKCFRGDSGDNVLPAFPKVRKTRLYKAYGVKDGKVYPELMDAFEMANLMDSEWEFVDTETGDKRMMSVAKMYEENNLLMNLSAQPDEIKAIIKDVIEHESENHGKFDYFRFQKFLGKYELKQIAENSQDYVNLFAGKKIVPYKTAGSEKKESVSGFQF